LRTKLRRVLAGQRLGCLQKSVWITPDSLGDLVGQLQSIVTTPEVLVFFEGRTFGGESPVAIAEAAWNFEEINRRWKDYAAHLRGLRKREEGLTVAGLEDWAKEDRRLWVRCLASDPLLPRELLPPAYGGLSAWKARGPVLRRAAELGRELIAKL
jgi:DNA-binding transcriptional regulator PaaX